jgi:hypothetical protein
LADLSVKDDMPVPDLLIAFRVKINFPPDEPSCRRKQFVSDRKEIDGQKNFIEEKSSLCSAENFFNLLLLNINWKIVVQLFPPLPMIPFSFLFNFKIRFFSRPKGWN